MVWALQVTENNAQITTLPSVTANLTLEWVVKFDNFNRDFNSILSGTQSNAFANDCFALGARSDGKPFVNMGGVGSHYCEGSSSLIAGTIYTIKAVFTGLDTVNPGSAQGTCELYIDDVLVGTCTPNSSLLHNAADSIPYIGFPSGSRSFNGKIYSGKMIGDTYDYQWSADASTHGGGQPILVSTVDANDFTGVNFPTDGSAWIEEGGDITEPSWVSNPAITQTTSVGHTLSQSINENGTIYGVMLPNGAAAPNAAQIKAGTDGNGNPALQALSVSATASVSNNLIFDAGSPGGAYDYHEIAEDAVPNLQPDGDVKSIINAVSSGVTLTIVGDVLRPGQTVNGNYSGIPDLAKVTLTDSQGNSIDTDQVDGPTLVDNGGGSFSLTMPALPTSGSKQLLLFGNVTATGVPAP